MKTRRPLLRRRLFWVVGALATGAALFQPRQALAEAPPLLLVQPFRLEGLDRWTTVVLSADPAAWRVGRADGPPATAAQLKAVLGAAKLLAVGLRCREARQDNTRYPCGLELAGPAVAPAAGLRWFATTGDTLTRYDDRGAPASVLASSMSGEAPPLARVLQAGLGVGEDYLGLFTLGGDWAAQGAGLALRLRVGSSPLRAAQPDLASGLVTIGTVNPFEAAGAKRDAV